MEIQEAQEKLENMHFDDIVKSYCNKVNDLEREKLKNKELLDRLDEMKKTNEPKLLTCIDCGKSDDTVKDRGAFNGIQCYACKKEQDIDDEECR